MKLLGNKISMATVLICISLMNACSYNEICNSIDVSMVDSVMVNVAEDEHSETSTDSLSGITDSQLTTEPSRVPDKTVTDVAESSSDTEYNFGNELFCWSYPGICKAYENISSDNNADNSIEQSISRLMDKNLICIYTYFTSALFQTHNLSTSVDDDGYYPIDLRFFENLPEFYEMLESTYTESISNKLIHGYITPGEPTFLEIDGMIMYNPNYTYFTTGPYFSDLGYKVEITEQSDSLCKFSYVPLYELLSDDEYNRLAECWGDDLLPHECEAVFENGEWLLNDIVFAF